MTVNNPSDTNLSWFQHKEEGKVHFQNGEYSQALASYRAALSASCPESEKQVLLSNIVACRLKIGGPAMHAAAVEEAKQCVSLNDRWAKGHVRLASAYIALGDHSNDACNALQRALALDPSNQTARQMLTRELRRDRIPPSPSAPSEEFDDSRPRRHPTPPSADATHIEESVPVLDRIRHYWSSLTEAVQLQWIKAVTWYHAQAEDVKTLLKVVLAVIVLYVLLGGRFGLGGNKNLYRGNYGEGNAYDRYGNQQRNYDSRPTYDSTYGSSSYGGSDYQRRATGHGNNYDYGYQGGEQSYSSYSYHFPNLFDGSVQSMIILAGIAYICHRNGINPFHALMMLNMFGGGRHRHGGMGGMGMNPMHYGMAGMGYGMARNAGMFGPQHPRGGFRRRGGWY